MIPVSLKLSNFTSYGEDPPTLDFTKFHLAAISGFNGAGKSSLLDSITWCIWGSSRAGDNADALIKLGQQEMSVDFSFDLDGNIFTVKRRRSKKSGGHTSLEFWSNSHNLTEGTIKATQQKIIDTLHLTYETFTNSAFLRQGHADEFTTKGATDRKRILADILGLDHYDRLEEKAKEKAKEAQTKLTLLEYQVLEIEAELSQKEEREQKLSEIKRQGEEIQKELKDLEVQIKIIEEEKQIVHDKVQSLQEQKQRLEDLKLEIKDLEVQIELKKKAQEEFQELLKRKSEIEENYQKIQKLEVQKKSLEQKRSELLKAKDELVAIEKQLNERENKRNQAINDVDLEIARLETENKQCVLQIETLKKDKSICPTCGQPIGTEKNQSLIKENQKCIDENETKLQTLKATLTKYQNIILPEVKLVEEKEKEVKNLEQQTKEFSEITQLFSLEKYADLFLKLQQAEVTVKAYTEAINDLEKIYLTKQKDLEKIKNFEQDLQTFLEKLQEVEQRLNAQNLVKAELQEKIMDVRAKYGEANQLVSRVKQMEDLFEQKQKDKKNLTQEKETYEELALAFGKKGIQAMIIENAIPEIEDEANRLLEKLTDGRMKISLETQKETKTKVQTADGKAHATVETLDIIISDEMGERAYELYSGGEAFRVNLAIRLAISKLLTHRAGAKLQFLILDEGFGTQDAQGRTRLVEVLDIIKNDFEKIVVITHIEELKEEFPTRIEVSKDAAGSTFAVVGT
jgi:DNA repair protein SbcC/Rad50